MTARQRTQGTSSKALTFLSLIPRSTDKTDQTLGKEFAYCSSALIVKPNSPKFSKRFSTQQMDTLGWECYLHVPARQSFLELPQEESNLPTAVEITLLC